MIDAVAPILANVKKYGARGDGITDDTAAIQAALDDMQSVGGTVFVPHSTTPYLIGTPLTVWSRVSLAGESARGSAFKALDGLNNAVIKLGATDGSDPYWHYGKISNLYIDGNKANQTAPASKTITAATITIAPYTATITTSAAHDFAIGDVVRISGMTPDAYNGDYRVASVPSPITFTIGQYVSSPSDATVTGTCRLLINGINIGMSGETSVVENCYITGCFDDGLWQGGEGTPCNIREVSSFANDGYGFDIWGTRIVKLDAPSGDLNGLGLIRCAGKSSAGGSGQMAVTTIVSPKAERHTVPVLTLDDYDGAVNVIGGGLEMDTSNTGPVMKRTSASSNSSLNVIGCRIWPKTTGINIFRDDSSVAKFVNSGSSSSLHYTFYVGNFNSTPLSADRIARRRVALTDSVTVSVNASLADVFTLSAGGSRTMAAPTGIPLGQPSAQEITFIILNNTAGAIATTWTSTMGGYKLAGAWTDPAAGMRRTIRFVWDGTDWVETGRGTNDI